MADAYWRYSDARHQAAAAMAPPSAALKRPRTDYADMPGGPEMLGYYSREDERTGHRVIRDTESIGASYDRYLRNGISSYGAGEPVRTVGGGISSHAVEDRRMMSVGGLDGRGLDGRSVGYGGGRPEPPLPPDASNTLFVEGLPANCTRREVSRILMAISLSFSTKFLSFSIPLLPFADIFRPFVGFREVRLVNKESRHPAGDPLVLCFVDFATPAQAAVALEALQGYKFDENDRESANLRLQFARFPGPRSSGGPRGRR